jgi:ABC-type glycerol-3-phosphate transport system substrate-binding protein
MRKLLIAGAAALAVAGCATGTTTTEPATSTTTAAVTTTAPAGPTVTDAQAQKLCSDIEAQLQNWRVQGPTLGRAGLNILVQTWAAESGTINLSVIQDRAIVDRVTTDTCADVRTQAIQELAIPDLASGLVGI